MTQAYSPNVPVTDEETYVFPVSYAQQRLWFLNHLDPASAAYNIPLIVELKGSLDLPALEDAFSTIVSRHETLRTTFVLEGGEPMQVVHSQADTALTVENFAEEENPRATAIARAVEESNAPFDLEAGPLTRIRVLRVGPDEHVLVLTLHHIVADGWSVGILLRELQELYSAAVQKREPNLSTLDLQYSDFAIWQRDWLTGPRLDDQLGYWRGQLVGAPAVLELPTDRPRPTMQSDRGAHCRALFSEELAQRLRRLAEEEGASLFMALVSALSVLLSRYSNQEDVVIGTPIANRTRVEVEPLIGFFANTLALRVDLSGNPSFRDLLRRTKEATLGAYAHQDLPFERLVSELNPERHLSLSPLFQVLFAFQQAGAPVRLPGVEARELELERGKAKFDLALFMSVSDRGLRASFEYSSDLFDERTVQRMLSHLESILEAVAADPDRPIAVIDLLTDAEHRELRSWNTTETVYPDSPRSVHELFEAQVARNPGGCAVRFRGQELSYEELDQRASRLAALLRSLGVAKDVPVGILIGRSLELPVAILAILKAGGAYAPLDPSYPLERLAFMLTDAAPPVLLTSSELLHRLPENGAMVLCLDDPGTFAEAGLDSTPAVVDREDLAYVLFTSGSTGRPKAVAMPHGPLVNLVQWQLENWTPPAPARTLQFASLSFDVAFQEIFSTLASGGTLVLVDEETRRDPDELLRFLVEEDVERLFLPFIALQQLADAAERSAVVPRSIRDLSTAGEALQVTPAIRRFFERLGGCSLHNHYGPTESHVVTAHTLTGPPQGWPERPAIGKPIANAHIHLLDPNGQLVPVGVRGELFIGGDVLARGYLNRPDLTAERFVRDPFRDDPQARLYRTGDLAVYRADGTLDYVARTDNQVKVRGYRVELGEIEAALRRHPNVREAVATISTRAAGAEQLVAYTVAHNGGSAHSEELRSLLAETLPDFMIPSAFVSLSALPMTPTGKVDRRSLPAPESGDFAMAGYVAPRNETERMLAALWQSVLGLDGPIGIRADFFALGGHSLLGVRLFAEIERATKVRLPLALLFQNATIEQLANAILREQDSTAPWSTIVPLRAGGTKPPLFLVAGIDGALLFYRELIDHLDEDQPVYGLQPPGLDRRRYPHTRIEDIAAHYVEELLRFQPEGDLLLAGHCFSGVVAYEVAHQLQQQGRNTAFLGLIDSSPFGHRRVPRLALERQKFAAFRAASLRGKTRWIIRRTRGIWLKLATRARWAAFDALVRRALPLPGPLWSVAAAGRRAMDHYVTPVSPCYATLFRATDATSSFYGQTFWSRLAQGGVEVRPIVDDGVRHDNILDEPHVQALAVELERCVENALTLRGRTARQERTLS